MKKILGVLIFFIATLSFAGEVPPLSAWQPTGTSHKFWRYKAYYWDLKKEYKNLNLGWTANLKQSFTLKLFNNDLQPLANKIDVIVEFSGKALISTYLIDESNRLIAYKWPLTNNEILAISANNNFVSDYFGVYTCTTQADNLKKCGWE